MSDLVSRLLAAIEEAERLANAATPGPWRVDDERYAEAIYGGDVGCVVGGGRWAGESSVFDSTEDALHIVHNDPAAVLRRCAADRTQLELHSEETVYGFDANSGYCGSCKYLLPCPTIHVLAYGYGLIDDGELIEATGLGPHRSSTEEKPPDSVTDPS